MACCSVVSFSIVPSQLTGHVFFLSPFSSFPPFSAQINGAVLSRRKAGPRISVWTRDRENIAALKNVGYVVEPLSGQTWMHLQFFCVHVLYGLVPVLPSPLTVTGIGSVPF